MKTLIQIGCNVGNDDVHEFLKKTQDHFRVLLVDPNKNSLRLCEEAYKNSNLSHHHIDFLNCAITPDDNVSQICFYIPKNDNSSPFASTIENHVVQHSHSDCEKIFVDAISINRLIQQYNVKSLDYLYVDTEGLCVDILLALDMDTYNIDTIAFEYIHSDGMLSYGGPKLNALHDKMLKYNYTGKKLGYNIVCTKNYESL